MAKQELDRARIAAITHYMEAHNVRIGEAVKALLVDDKGDALPFVLLVPTATGTHTIANLETDTVANMLRVLAGRLEAEALQKMFANALASGMARIVAAAELTAPDDDDIDTTPNGTAH